MYNLKRLKKKGISPVIASIILIAITIAIAIAVAGWVFGLFGTYGTGGGVSIAITNLEAGATDTPCSVNFTVTNSKSMAVTITAITVQGTTVSATGLSLAAPAATTISFSQNLATTGPKLTVGMVYTVRFTLSDGTSITTSWTAS
ncbi:MAG: archaellin/type IV pilin N-terminal domain-containing protein [Nitrososphaerales archaeon]